jgi:hypothetical protein
VARCWKSECVLAAARVEVEAARMEVGTGPRRDAVVTVRPERVPAGVYVLLRPEGRADG